MKTCKNCVHYGICTFSTIADKEIKCKDYICKTDYMKVVRCKDCKHSRPIDNTKSPEKYFKDYCIVCECQNVVGDEPTIYVPWHFCSYGERK